MSYDVLREVLVVGAGVVGLSAAYHLQRAGFDVTLLEKGVVGKERQSPALSEALFGCPLSVRTVLEERGLELASIFANEFGYSQQLASGRYELEQRYIFKTRLNYDVQLKDLLIDLLIHCIASGVRVMESQEVAALIRENCRITGCSAASKSIACRNLVLCAGRESESLLRGVGIDLPVTCINPVNADGDLSYVGRPCGIDGLIVAFGSFLNPAASLAVGEMMVDLAREEQVGLEGSAEPSLFVS